MSWCESSDDTAKLARQEEAKRQANIKSGMRQINTSFAGFDNDFYKQREQDYIRFAMPQLYRQAGEANRQGFYSLADRGLGKSSAADKFGSDLAYETNVQKQGVVDQAMAQRQQLQQQVEGQRGQLVAQLQASADPVSAAQQALASAGSYSLPSTFAPLGNMFGNFSQIYANNQIAKAYQPQQYQSQYGLQNSALANKPYSISK